ncbi:MAG: energy-coupled thiamine transporter ThiT [Defluviitaleaceae bacterium]|nr:energy-coupled thiamine transporter ThiT [Defluviitaleaceae bacterium]
MENFIIFDGMTLGELLAFVIAVAVFIAVSSYFFKRANFSTKALTYTGLSISLAFVLSYFRLFSMPQGGSVTMMSMFFVTLVGYWFGPGIGLISAFSYGLLQFVQGAYIVHPVQLLVDYPLAFGALGLSGFFYKMKGGLYIGFAVACFGRFVMHTISGIFFFAMYAPPEISGAGLIAWSATSNAFVIFPEMILTLAVTALPPVKNALAVVKTRVLQETAIA